MKIGIIGAGRVGSTLGKRWAVKEHSVMFGVRNIAKYADLDKLGNIQVSTLESVIKSNSILVLTVPGSSASTVIQSLGDLADKIILDVTNMSGMNNLKQLVPKAHFVKAFNTMGFNIMSDPIFGDQSADSFLCGDNSEALKIAKELSIDLGFNPVVLGDSSFAQDLENLALLWIKSSRNLGRQIAFKLLQKPIN